MEFTISEEQKAFMRSVFGFTKNEITPMMEEYEKKGEFCWQAWKKMAEFGMMALPFPEEFGGAGAGVLTTCLGMESLAHGGASGGTTLSWGAHTILCGVPIWQPAVGLLGLAVTAYLFVLLSARFFRADTLLSSSGLNLKRIVEEFRRT